MARVTIAVLVGLPVVANGLMIAAPPDAGADGLGRFWPGVVALLTIPASWPGALLVGGLSRHRARIESGSSG